MALNQLKKALDLTFNLIREFALLGVNEIFETSIWSISFIWGKGAGKVQLDS